MGLGFTTPADWAAARHDLRREAGRLVLIDRRRQRLQLTWSALPEGTDPDPATLAADWRKRLEAARGGEDGPPELRPLGEILGDPGPCGWTGWVGHATSSAGPLTRTDAVAAVGNLLVDAVLLDPSPAPEEASLRLLRSAASADLPGGGTRWTAFGIDAAAPPGWSAAAARHEPAASVLTFAGPDRTTARLWRRGMASSWFDGDVLALLAASTPAGFKPAGAAEAFAPSDAAEAAGVEPCRLFARLAGKARHRRDLLWHDAAANAVLGVTLRGPRRVTLPDPVGFLPAATSAVAAPA